MVLARSDLEPNLYLRLLLDLLSTLDPEISAEAAQFPAEFIVSSEMRTRKTSTGEGLTRAETVLLAPGLLDV